MSWFSGGANNDLEARLLYSSSKIVRFLRSWEYDIRADNNDAIDLTPRFELLDILSKVISHIFDYIVSDDDNDISFSSFLSTSLSMDLHASSSSKSRRSCSLINVIFSSNVCEVLIYVSTLLFFVVRILLFSITLFISRKLILSN